MPTVASRIEGQAAYVLHTRPYRDTSLLVDLFTLEHGKVSVVAKGARRAGSKLRSSLQPFTQLDLAWRGKHALKNLSAAEPAQAPRFISGRALMCGMYVNELLERLLQGYEPFPQLYVYYQYLLNELECEDDIEGALRTFEHKLLIELGVMPALTEIAAASLYIIEPQRPPRVIENVQEAQKPYCFYGHALLAIADDCYDQPAVRASAKRLNRLLIEPLLKGKPLHSRELFMRRVATQKNKED